METPKPMPGPAADAPPRRSVWQRSVAVVILLVCGTLVATGYINFRLAQLYDSSDRERAALSQLQAALGALSPLVDAVAARATGVFGTGEPARASGQLDDAVAAFDREFSRLRGAALATVPPQDARAVGTALDDAHASFQRLAVHARDLLSQARLGERDDALQQVAAMNRRSQQVDLALGQVQAQFRARQRASDEANAATARRLRAAETAMLGIAVLVATVVLLYGRRVSIALRHARRQTEELVAQTRASDERFAFAARSTLDGIWDYDPAEGSSYHSERLLELLGLPPGTQLDMRRFDELVHPDDLPRALQARAAHLVDHAPVALELRLRTANGDYRWFLVRNQSRWDADGRLLRRTGSLSDITDRKSGDLRLAESAARLAAERSRLAAFVEHAPAAIAMFDSSLRYVGASRRWMETFLHGKREVVGLPFYEVFGDIPRAWRTELSRVLEGEIVSVEDERWRPAQSTTERHLRWEARPWLEQGSAQPGVLLFAQDITHDREREAALERMRDAADAANRAKSEFLATMSHEIRTPMNGVLGFTQLLLDTSLDAEQRQFARTIDASGRSLLALLNDILDYSKIEAGKLRVEVAQFDLRVVIDEVAALLSSQCQDKGLELQVDYPPDAPRALVGDAARVRQVLTNLVGNAIKFTARGHVRIDVRRDADDTVRVDVRDTGIGIATDLQPSLFNKFVQADSTTTRRFGGTGLGLAICRQLVGLMHGDIGVHSVEGQGSTFWFRLPAPAGLAVDEDAADVQSVLEAPRAAVAAGPPATTAAPRPDDDRQPGPSILLVEDHTVNRKLVLRVLGKLGYHADVAEDGAAAVQMAAKRRYDLILMDCQLPRLDGFEATAGIRRHEALHGGRAAIVALTAGTLPAERERCLASGMQGFLTKPLVLAELRQALERWAPLPGDAPPTRPEPAEPLHSVVAR